MLDGEAERLKHISPLYANLLMVPVPIFHNQTTALILGYGFKPSDLACYCAGILLGSTLDRLLRTTLK